MSSLLESDQNVETPYDPDALETTILDHLNEQTVISLDTLVCLMPQYTWNQIFHRVDQLSRCNKVVLRRHRFEYTLFSTNFLA
ncbi:MAG TPA: hypothetical protein VE222_12745 [Nitrospiraceae bacterium]|nr:hypothetical protein [Nitrospiraceae bacterium]